MNSLKIRQFGKELLFAALFFVLVSGKSAETNIIASGKQPQISYDVKGVTRIVYGRNDSIFYLVSKGNGEQFSTEQLVAYVPNMHLGTTRGPQLATSNNYSVITAIDKDGEIHWFLLNHKSGKWTNKGFVNDKRRSAPEGLMSISADKADNFYAVWLDLRVKNSNNIYFSSMSTTNNRWSPNKLVYRSPDGHTCECCKPDIAARNNHIAISFRNWLNGSRDIYCIESYNRGKTFGIARKQDTETWKLDGCPMDGGGISIDDKNIVHTIWQREGTVYHSTSNGLQQVMAKGRSCNVAIAMGKVICSYQQGDDLKLKDISEGNEISVGKGKYIQTAVFANKRIVCVWEKDNNIIYRKI